MNDKKFTYTFPRYFGKFLTNVVCYMACRNYDDL